MRDPVAGGARIRRLCQVLAAVAICIGATVPARTAGAQSLASSSQQQPARPAPPTAGWDDGFFLQSANGDYRLVFGLVGQLDGRFSLDDPAPVTSTFSLRKLRPTLTGRIARYFEFKMMPDFGNGSATVPDAYVDLRLSAAFRVRTGKDKTPVGYELLQADGNLWFPERSLASSLVPNRDLGVQVQGDIDRAKLTYAAGVFNGVPDGASSTTELDTNGSKDLAGRVMFQPFRRPAAAASAVSGLGFHLGGSFGRQSGPLPSFRTSVGQTYFSYRADASAAGDRSRVTPAVFYYFRSFGGFAEYMRSSQRVARAATMVDVLNRGWQVSAAWFPTGEAASYGTIRPAHNFDPPQHHYGALQVVARFSELRVDPTAFDAQVASVTASSGAKAVSVDVTWFPNPFIKYYATYERTVFGAISGDPRSPENVVVVRAQVAF